MKIEKSKKIHFELSPANLSRMLEYIENYNKDLKRVTPKIKYTDVINRALDNYLSKRESDIEVDEK